MPNTVFSKAPSYAASRLSNAFSSASANGVSARLDATCISIVDGLRRKEVAREFS